MNFSFHQLRIFCEVVQHTSITKAAEKLRLTQPALSIQLRNFQDQFELPLYYKKGRGIGMTPYGLSIFEIAKRLLDNAKEITYQTEAYKNLEAGQLKIASVSTGKYIIPFLVAGFLKKYPKVDLQIEVSNKEEVSNRLAESEIDFALVSVLPSNVLVHEEILFENRLYLVSNEPSDNPDAPLIFREPGSATRQAMDEYFKETSHKKSFELSTNEAVKQAVIAGLGQSILPLIGIADELERGQLHIIERPGLPIITHWRIVYNRSQRLSPLALTFLTYLQENKASLIETYFD